MGRRTWRAASRAQVAAVMVYVHSHLSVITPPIDRLRRCDLLRKEETGDGARLRHVTHGRRIKEEASCPLA